MINISDDRTGLERRISEFLGAFPDEFIHLSPPDQALSALIYRLMAETGKPVSLAELAARLPLTTQEVQEKLAGRTGIFYDDHNRIIGYWGLTTKQMSHRFVVNGHTLYTWCAWDSLFIPWIIGRTARVESVDPETKEIIQLIISPDKVLEVEPRSAVTSFIIPELDKVRSDVIRSFCHYVHFFASEETAEEWVSTSEKKADLVILSLVEAYRIGAEKNRLQYRDILGAQAADGVA